ncbi:hypothetical protein DFP85_11883 [Halomonas ventosae]|uniref:Uncharacterized protein n=1 Tax=Halomonas ventosae TaxID=229007 RepID=A0A4R6ZGB9_9GAMM|nr:hypothetical protein [Halomonas ventosae]TDR51301.1 hypothetical protein DFP85_11883 [Halomonas ventosae]
MSYRVILAKILDERFVQDFLDGNLFMNTDAYFSQLDTTDELRADAHEGLDEAWQVKDISIMDDSGEYVPIGGVQNPVGYRYGQKANINILCLYMFRNDSSFGFDERNIGFGNTAILINDAKEFVNRLKAASSSAGRSVLQGPVEYVEKNTYHGTMGPFRKFSEYSYQSEFRFVLFGGTAEPIKFPIGDLRDICNVVPSSELPKLGITQ